ncbi:hypothetical protein D9M71_692340 [compost metagenome]
MPEKNDRKQMADGFRINDFFLRMLKQWDCLDLNIQYILLQLIGQNSLIYLLHKLCHAVLIVDKLLIPLADGHSFQMLIAGRREAFHVLSILYALFGAVHHYRLS